MLFCDALGFRFRFCSFGWCWGFYRHLSCRLIDAALGLEVGVDSGTSSTTVWELVPFSWSGLVLSNALCCNCKTAYKCIHAQICIYTYMHTHIYYVILYYII